MGKLKFILKICQMYINYEASKPNEQIKYLL